jgi:hypothetical protein
VPVSSPAGRTGKRNATFFVALNHANASDAGDVFAEHLLNIRLQMGCFGATEEPVTLTKHMKIGLCEQVRVN